MLQSQVYKKISIKCIGVLINRHWKTPILNVLQSIILTKLQRTIITETNCENIKEHFETFKTSLERPLPKFSEGKELVFGTYAIEGYNPDVDSKPYFGNLTLRGNESNVEAQWEIGFEGQYHYGVGFYHEGKICISFSYFDGDDECKGKVIYQIGVEEIVGCWSELNGDGVGVEIARLKQRID